MVSTGTVLQCAIEPLPAHGRLDAEDMARVLAGFRGPVRVTPTMRYVRAATDNAGSAYVFDEDSGMVYILD